jgi:excisionase family DNA binding protein
MTENPTNPTSKQHGGMIRVSISDAARLFGVNAQTIRRAVANKEVSYVVVAGRYKINFESLVRWSQQKTTVKNKTEKFGIGQYVDKWKIKNTLYSPSPKTISQDQSKDNEQKA